MEASGDVYLQQFIVPAEDGRMYVRYTGGKESKESKVTTTISDITTGMRESWVFE